MAKRETCDRCGEADATEEVGSFRWCKECLDKAVEQTAKDLGYAAEPRRAGGEERK